MIPMQRRWHNVHGRVTRALVLFALGLGATTSTAQSKKTPSPSVVGASVPFYPRVPMLARAAKENMETWQFEQHTPTSFEATFRYKLLPSECDAQCSCDSVEKGTILLRLPDEVEVSAKELMICDAAVELKH